MEFTVEDNTQMFDYINTVDMASVTALMSASESQRYAAILDTFYFVVGLAGFFINMFVFIVLITQRSTNAHVTEYLIMNQILMDGVVSLCVFLLRVAKHGDYYEDTALELFICKFFSAQFLEYGIMSCSIYNLVNITISQYFDVVHPTAKLTSWWKKHKAFVVLWPWVVGLGIFSGISLPHTGIAGGMCIPLGFWPDRLTYTAVLSIPFVPETFLPVITFTYAFARMTMRLKGKSAPKIKAASGSQQPQQQPAVFQSARANMMRTWTFLFVAYAICVLPQKILAFCLVIDVIHINAWFNSSYYPLTASLYFASTIINPFIFGVKYRKFQDGVRNIFGKYVARFRRALPTTNSNSVATSDTVT